MTGLVRVAAAVILRADGSVLLAQRPPGRAYAGYWEFPGGKLEPGETPARALARELSEELGIAVRRASPWLVQEYVYPHAHVELHFFRVFDWSGEPHGHDGQAFSWQTPGAFTVAPLLPANTRVLAALGLPAFYGITCAAALGEGEFLDRAKRSLAGGLRLIQVREKDWSADRIARFVEKLAALAQPHGATLLLNGEADEARRLGLGGVHWTAARLAQARSRPRGLLVGASCHTRAEIARAGELDLDFVVLGPVRATPTHPESRPLGWDAFEQRIEGTRVPVYALGGLARADLDTALDRGAHGVAMLRGAWAARDPLHG